MAAERWLIDTEPSQRFPVYTRLNANDVLPDPITPLGASLAWIPNILPGFSTGYAFNGAITAAEAYADGISPAAAFFYGHMYVNMTMPRMVGIRGGMGWEIVDAAFFAAHPDAPPHTPVPEDIDEERSAAMAARNEWTLTTTTFPELEEERQLADRCRAERPDLAAMSPAALIARARSVMPLERFMWRGEMTAGSQSAVGPAIISSLVGAADPTLMVKIIGYAGDVDSAAPSYVLWDLSRVVHADPELVAEFDKGVSGLTERVADHPVFGPQFATFVKDFGYRGPSEWDIGADSWETRPELALGLIDRLRTLDDDASPSARQQSQVGETDEALARALEILAGNDDAIATLHLAIASARRFGAWRERAKANCIKVLHEGRVALHELGVRLTAQGHIASPRQLFMCLDNELDVMALAPQTMTAILAEREQQWQSLFGLEIPTFVEYGKPLAPLSSLQHRGDVALPTVAVGDVLTGVPASGGKATGRARVIVDTANIADFEPGEILVAPQTDPSWTPLFLVSSGVVVDVGAMASHAMIVSRELGIPCAAGVTGATQRIPTGALIEVDGSAGTVTVLEL